MEQCKTLTNALVNTKHILTPCPLSLHSFTLQNQTPQGPSFKEFCDRPENKDMLAKQQRQEIRQMERGAEESGAREFRERVLASGAEAQRNVAPYLEIPVLRRIIKTFTNDTRGDFEKWACNPLVLEMLKRAKSALDEGRLTEQEAETVMIGSLLDGGKASGSGNSSGGSKPGGNSGGKKVRVETNNLVSALNEHVQLRMRGNSLYEQRRFPESLRTYTEGTNWGFLQPSSNVPKSRHTVLSLSWLLFVHTSRYTRLTLSFLHRKRFLL